MNATKAQEVTAVRHGYTSEVYDDKSDALAIAHAVAKESGYCFAVQGRFGWHACQRKPSLGGLKVIECRDDGKEYLA
jgi:hypothetical protein